MPSFEIVVLLLVAYAAILYFWWRDWRARKKLRQLVEWIERTHPAAWDSLPRWPRRLFPHAGIEEIKRSGVVVDSEFDRAYADWKAAKASGWLLLLAAVAIGLIGLGVRTLEWQW